MFDAGFVGLIQHSGEWLMFEFQQVQMTMGVDQHGIFPYG
jgi:hypothetical protein